MLFFARSIYVTSISVPSFVLLFYIIVIFTTRLVLKEPVGVRYFVQRYLELNCRLWGSHPEHIPFGVTP